MIIALLTKEEGCSDKDIKWASHYNISEVTFLKAEDQPIKGKMRRVILFETNHPSILPDITSMDGWYFIQKNGIWDYINLLL